MRRAFWITALAVLLLASNVPLADWLCERVEAQYPPIPVADMPTADAIVVLGGGIDGALPPRVIPHLTAAGSRSWYAARLWKAGKAPKVVNSGGARGSIPEAAAMSEFLIDLGVAPAAIIEESSSRSTVENALRVKPVLAAHQIGRVLLVTSALHMPRALAIFRAVGIEAVPASADSEVVANRGYRWADFVPNAEALGRTTRVVKEVLGLVGYRIQLWLADSRATEQA